MSSSSFSPNKFEKVALKFEEKLHAVVKWEEKEIFGALPKLIREAMDIYKQYPQHNGRLLHYFIGYVRGIKFRDIRKDFLVSMVKLDLRGELWKLAKELDKAGGSGEPTGSKTDPKQTVASSSAKPKSKQKESVAAKSQKGKYKSAEYVDSDADYSEPEPSRAPTRQTPAPKTASAKEKGKTKQRKAKTLDNNEDEEAASTSRKRRKVAGEDGDADEETEVVKKPKTKKKKTKGKRKTAAPVAEDGHSEGEEKEVQMTSKPKRPKSKADQKDPSVPPSLTDVDNDNDNVNLAELRAAFVGTNVEAPMNKDGNKPNKKRKQSADPDTEVTHKDKKAKLAAGPMSSSVPKMEQMESPSLQVTAEPVEPMLGSEPKSEKRRQRANAEAGSSKPKDRRRAIVSDVVMNINQKLAERGVSEAEEFKGEGKREDWIEAEFVCLPCYRSQKICLLKKKPKKDRAACLNCHIKKKKCPYSSGGPVTHGMGVEGEVVLGERDDMSMGETDGPLSYGQALGDILLGVRATNKRMAALEMEVTRLRADLEMQMQIGGAPTKVFQDVGVAAVVSVKDFGVAADVGVADKDVTAQLLWAEIGIQVVMEEESKEDANSTKSEVGPRTPEHVETSRKPDPIVMPHTPDQVETARRSEQAVMAPTPVQVEVPWNPMHVQGPTTAQQHQENTDCALWALAGSG